MHPAPMGTFALHLLDVGQGESTLIDFPEGHFALIDAGPTKAQRVILDAVEARLRLGRSFRFAALTHWDADHVGALPAVLRRHAPREIVRPSVDMALLERLCGAYEKVTTPALIDAVKDAWTGIEQQRLDARQPIRDIGKDVEIWALSPARTVHERLEKAAKNPGLQSFEHLRNASSLVLWIRVFGRSLLLPGEVDMDRARELADQFDDGHRPARVPHGDPRVVWLKLAHHGSKTGTNTDLLSLFAQDSFVASASHGAHYDHPHPRVLDQVRKHNGVAMCTRLGKGCRLILDDPAKYPERNPGWTDSVNFKRLHSPKERCYSSISVTIRGDGHCEISGAANRIDCPYGGPSTGAILM